jgi:hypothetical protein
VIKGESFVARSDLGGYHDQDRSFVRALAQLFGAWNGTPGCVDFVAGDAGDDHSGGGAILGGGTVGGIVGGHVGGTVGGTVGRGNGSRGSGSNHNHDHPDRHTLMRAPAPEIQLARSGTLETFHRSQWELARLESVYTATQASLAAARVARARAAGRVRAAETTAGGPRDALYRSMTLGALRAAIDETSEALARKRVELCRIVGAAGTGGAADTGQWGES